MEQDVFFLVNELQVCTFSWLWREKGLAQRKKKKKKKKALE